MKRSKDLEDFGITKEVLMGIIEEQGWNMAKKTLAYYLKEKYNLPWSTDTIMEKISKVIPGPISLIYWTRDRLLKLYNKHNTAKEVVQDLRRRGVYVTYGQLRYKFRSRGFNWRQGGNRYGNRREIYERAIKEIKNGKAELVYKKIRRNNTNKYWRYEIRLKNGENFVNYSARNYILKKTGDKNMADFFKNSNLRKYYKKYKGGKNGK